MTASIQAIFLSYASQDADAARRICDVLRTAGLEVWLDQSELRGGDAWDASIRNRIKECALFVPLISANTNARSEGYFRLEWKIAVDRSHLMADDQAFLLPIIIDDTLEATARVPDRFRERQWSRVEDSVTSAAFAKRVARLVSSSAPPVAAVQLARASAAAVTTNAISERESPSIAVLPFVNMSRDEENEYFADGLSEELMNVLSKIRGLRVASRTSAFAFKGKGADIPTVAQKLNVATVLEGSVRKSGKRVRITAQLIQVSTDSHLWSQTYDRELEDIFAVQDDIAQSVVKELRTALLGASAETATGASVAADVRQAATGRSDNPEAFQLYLQGKFFGERPTQADTDKAIDLFRRALAIDPKFALAWTGLSRVHQVQAGYGYAPIEDGYERARDAAQQALRLAPDLAEGHIELGRVFESYDWNWVAADASLRHALALAPGHADALSTLAGLARIVGRRDEALELIRKALALDPLSVLTHRQAGMIHFLGDRFDDAAAAFRFAIELNPRAGLAHAFLAVILLHQGRSQEALSLAQAESHDGFRHVAVAMIQHAVGNSTESDAALHALIEGFAWTAAYQIAEAYAFRNEIDKAFEWLERAYMQRDPGVVYTATDSLLRHLHGDPRWRPFVERMHLA